MFWWPKGFSDLCFGVWKRWGHQTSCSEIQKSLPFVKLKWDSYTGIFSYMYSLSFCVLKCKWIHTFFFNLCVLLIPFKTKNNVIMYLYIQWWISRSFYISYCVSLDSNWRLSRFKKKHTLPAWLTWTIDVIVPCLIDCP